MSTYRSGETGCKVHLQIAFQVEQDRHKNEELLDAQEDRPGLAWRDAYETTSTNPGQLRLQLTLSCANTSPASTDPTMLRRILGTVFVRKDSYISACERLQ